MKLKDLLLPMAFAILVTSAIQYFFLPQHKTDSPTAVTDKSFVAPASAQAAEPLDFDVDFVDKPAMGEKQITTVTTPTTIIEFSNNGAVIDRIAYKRMLSGKESLMETVIPASREQGAFLVALNGLGNTPYYYTLINREIINQTTVITYRGESDTASITKQFTVYHDSYKMDLEITVEPKAKAQNLRARLFFPGPLPVDSETDLLKIVLSTENKAIEKRTLKESEYLGKERPSLFGLETRYFLNIAISDPQSFAQRAYFKIEGVDRAAAVLQTGIINQKTTWNLSFYCGPKEIDSLVKVDKRLEKVLEFGILAPISKPLLYLLNFLYRYLKNYGFAIIVLTILIKLIMAPFMLKTEQNRRQQLEVQKKLKYIEQKYKNDPEALAREKTEYIRKHGMSGMLGCLPLLLQVPIFIGLNRVLSSSIELYKAPFIGWIQDLSARDSYYILPALVGLGMVLQTTQTNDPRQYISNILIALIITGVTANLAAGLALFIALSTLLGVAQTYIQKALKL